MWGVEELRTLVRVILFLYVFISCQAAVAPAAGEVWAAGAGVTARPVVRKAATLPARGWMTLETVHFFIHFPPGSEQLARKVAVEAEAAHRSLVPLLEHIPDEKTHLVLADTTDLFGGEAYPTPYNCIVLNPVYPDNIAYQTGVLPGGGEKWLATLLLHEYTHILHIDMKDGATAGLRQLLGRVPTLAFPNSFQGPGVIEGYAVHQEELEGSGRGEGSLYRMFLKAAVIYDNIPTWDQINGYYELKQWYPVSPPYLFGYDFIDYLARVWGEDKLAEVHRHFTALPLYGFGSALEKSLGLPFKELWAKWRQDLVARFRDMSPEEIDARTKGETLPVLGRRVLWPAFSPDGRLLVYGAEGGVTSSLRYLTFSARGYSDRHLVDGQIGYSNGVAWLPDGSGVIYARLEYDRQGRFLSDLYLYDLKKKSEHRLTEGYRAFAPTVSPDGRHVIFLSRQAERTRLLIGEMMGGRLSAPPQVLWPPVQPAESGAATERITYVSWSPGGNTLALALTTAEGESELGLLSLVARGSTYAAGSLKVIYKGNADHRELSWSPDGRYLLFASDSLGSYNIQAYDLETEVFYQVTEDPLGAFAPAVSPDGRSWVYVVYRGDGFKLVREDWRPAGWRRWPAAEEAGPAAGSAGETAWWPAAAEEDLALFTSTIRLTPEETASAFQSTGEGTVEEARTSRRSLAPWEIDLLQLVDPESFQVRPYNALLSLTPRYWLPVWDDESGNILTGIATANHDALRHHAYDIGLKVGGSLAAYDLHYRFSPDPVINRRTIGLRLSGMRLIELETDEVRRLLSGKDYGELYTSIAWPRADGQSGLKLMWQWEKETGHSTVNRTALAWTWAEQHGAGVIERSKGWQVTAHLGWPLKEKEAGMEASWWMDYGRINSWRLKAGGVLGMQTKEEILLGERNEPWRIRGAARTQGGKYAALTTFEATLPLVAVKRGLVDYPFFVDGFSATLFVDAGVTGRHLLESRWQATAGLELVAAGSADFGYSLSELCLGAARPLDGSAPFKFYFRLVRRL